MASPTVVEMALAQVEQGFAAFALLANAKTPITKQGFKNATTKPEWIRTQLEAPAAGNYGITWPVDAPERVLALDLDDGSDGRERPWQDRLLELIGRIGPLPPTKSTTTPSGGRHAFYRWPSAIPIPAGDELFGFTVRWPGRGYLVGPGSSIDGVAYLPGPTPEIADLPDPWVEAAIASSRPRRAHDGFIVVAGGGFELPDRIPSGRRYATVRDYVASRYNAGLGPDELWELVRSQVAPRFDSPKPEQELRGDFDRVMAKIVERLGPPRRSTAAPAIPVGPLEDAALTEFTSEPVEWLWQAWLPKGTVTLMDGNPGVSKSTLVADLVARITRGRDWPDETPGSGVPGRVMWITTEDDPGRVLRPRIEAVGGDASLVRFVTSEVVFPTVGGAFRELVVQRASEVDGLELVVLDPLFSHIEATVKTISDADMRKGVMNPLGEAALAADVAILVVRHFSKDRQATALTRGAGSLGGIVGAARSVWTVTVDHTDPSGETKAVGVSKLNYAKIHKPLLYSVVEVLPPGWVTGSVAGISWRGPSKLSIDELLTEIPKADTAAKLLRELIEERGGEMSSIEATETLRGAGFSQRAVNAARDKLEIVPRKLGMSQGWVWRLPDERDSSREDNDAEDSQRDSSKNTKNHGRDSSGASRARAQARAQEAPLCDSSIDCDSS
ncbi:MAG: AAA family ATPase, partial [Chloroflexi bacterium]|nr:AAA family ATPase [Chloroflexota bacterium]